MNTGGGVATPVSLFRLDSLSRDDCLFLRVLSCVVEGVCAQLPLQVLARLARCCRALRFLTADEGWLSLLLSCAPARPAVATRMQFMLSARAPLQRLRRGQYMQAPAFLASIRRHKTLAGLRAAHLTRKARREAYNMRVQRYRERLLRCRASLSVAGLSPGLLWTTEAGARFRMRASWFSDSMLAHLVEHTVDTLCWQHYLLHYTPYAKQLMDHKTLFGDYEGAEQNVANFFDRPATWPWQQRDSAPVQREPFPALGFTTPPT
jgi:hypothetical protein